jgi:hypothetical protein
MLLFVLLACSRSASDFEVSFASPVTTCPAGEVPYVPSSSDVRLWRSDGGEDGYGTTGTFGVAPFGVCENAAGGFRCALAGLDARDDLTDAGVDAVVTQDLSFEGRWRDGGVFADDTLEGTLGWAVRCEGSDCDALEGAMPTPCDTRWSWSATPTFRYDIRTSCERGDVYADVGAYAYGPAPWDPYAVSDQRPVLVDEDGLLPLVPYVTDVVSAEAGLFAVTPEQPGGRITSLGGWGPGDAAGWDRELCPQMRTFEPSDESWTIGEHGRVEGFVPERALGAWSLDDGVALGFGDLLPGFVYGLRLEVLSVADGRAAFRIVAPYFDGDGECVVLADHGDLSSTGELTWSTDARIVVPAEPAPLVVYHPRIRIGFDADGTSAAGGEAGALVDVRATDGMDLDVCELSANFGAPCVPCPDDGEPWCLTLAALAYQGDPAPDVEVGAPLPLCGADFTAEVPEIDLDCGGWDGTLCVGASVIVVAPLRRLRRRERRGAPSPLR